MSRPTRIAGSFAIVVIVYWAYALLAVPWIEPPIAKGSIKGPSDPIPGGDLADEQIKQLKPIFPPGAWQVTNPKILESDRAKLLFLNYKNFPDGRVEIKPCTIVVPYEGPGDEAQRIRQSIILDAPGGAVLQFDQPLDLTRAKVGRLVGGRLSGEVVIRSDSKDPGPEDDLKIVTRDVELTQQTITTPYPVEFCWGPNFGRGREMVMRLLTDPAPAAGGMNILGIESFELRHVEQLHLDLGPAMGSVGASNRKPESTPVEVRCRGPFRFDAVGHVATFRDDVEVVKLNPTSPPDQIACQLLSLFFAERKGPSRPPPAAARGPGTGRRWGAPKPPPPSAPSLDMVAERLEAQGRPAVLTASSQAVTARGQRMEYNLLTKSIALDGSEQVFLQQGPNEIHARSLRYEAAEQGRIGRVAAQGPGWLRGQLAEQPGAPMEAVWKGQLQVAPEQQNQVVSLTGGAELNFQGMGQLQASEIFLWLAEAAPGATSGASRLRPDRMLARNAVHIASAQLSGNVEQLEVWFEEAGAQGSGVGGQGSGIGGNQRPGTAVPGDNGQGNPSRAVPPALPQAQPTSPQRFEVVGRLLRARVSLGGATSGVSHLVVEDGVRFLETQTAQPGERPLLVRGDRLEITDASGPQAAVTVVGQLARFEARGLGLTGTNIHLNRGENRLWIDGAGQMDMPLSGGLPGQPAAPGGVMTVDWRRGMTFDGRTATFTGAVVAASPSQKLQTDSMQVQLQRPVNFSEPALAGPPQVEKIRCVGGVRMENQARDLRGQLTAFDKMQVTDLAVNLLSGELNGGPGELNSVRHGSDNPFGGAPAGGPNAAAPAAVPPNAAALKCLHVNWEGSIVGNLLRRQLTFRDQVRTGYAPVDGWEKTIPVDNPDKLGPDGVTVGCDQLSVAQTFTPLGGQQKIELQATGNASVEGTTFKALGNRITYDEAKDLLILEGDGRTDATLFRQPQVGVPTSKLSAAKIWYWPKTKRGRIEGTRSMEVNGK